MVIWLNRCCFASYHCTKTIQWVASLQPNWTAAFLKLASVTDTSMNLVPWPMVMLYGPNDRNFFGLDRIFPKEKIRKKSGEFEGKILLAHEDDDKACASFPRTYTWLATRQQRVTLWEWWFGALLAVSGVPSTKCCR